MKTFLELQSRISRDLAELSKLEASRSTSSEERSLKEQNIGRLCYEAEEDLSTLELHTLKWIFGMSDIRWRTYKTRFIAGRSPEEFI